MEYLVKLSILHQSKSVTVSANDSLRTPAIPLGNGCQLVTSFISMERPIAFLSDNGFQYNMLLKRWLHLLMSTTLITHIIGSPHYPQGNGFAEWMVQTAKNFIGKSSDPYPSHSRLLEYPVTMVRPESLSCSFS